MITAKELRTWLADIADDELLGIDPCQMAITTDSPSDFYIEIGGVYEEDSKAVKSTQEV